MISHPPPKLDDVLHQSLSKSIRHRVPWLVTGLLGGLLASGIVGKFENTLSENLVLAAFIPLIVYMSDAVGTQMEAFVIRDTAMHSRLNITKYVLKQFYITTTIAVILAVLLFIFSLISHTSTKLSLVLSLSLFISILSSIVTGSVLPIIFERFKLDPANASGPIATIIQDLLSVTIYFSIASALL